MGLFQSKALKSRCEVPGSSLSAAVTWKLARIEHDTTKQKQP